LKVIEEPGVVVIVIVMLPVGIVTPVPSASLPMIESSSKVLGRHVEIPSGAARPCRRMKLCDEAAARRFRYTDP